MKNDEKNILPLMMDLTNPSPYLGWENDERMSFMKRGPIDLVMALALIHHLAISNNLPFDRIAQFFQKICKSLIIEFVPKTDSQVQRLLATREDIFDNYNTFRVLFNTYFDDNYEILEDKFYAVDIAETYYMDVTNSLINSDGN